MGMRIEFQSMAVGSSGEMVLVLRLGQLFSFLLSWSLAFQMGLFFSLSYFFAGTVCAYGDLRSGDQISKVRGSLVTVFLCGSGSVGSVGLELVIFGSRVILFSIDRSTEQRLHSTVSW